MQLYDTIGHGYQQRRQPDPRIAAQILQGLGRATSVLNVGAGAGSYEPRDRQVIAVEPSMVMIRQRVKDAAPAVQASGTHLPFRDACVDASLAILTIHHWPDLARGLQELVNACHAHGLAVVLDVVYNHLGPEGNYFPAFGPYFTSKYKTPWGDAVNYDDAGCDGVLSYFAPRAARLLRA